MSGSAAPRSAPPARIKAIVARLDAYERLVRLDKPIGILLLLWPTLSALWLAALGTPPWSQVLIFTMGTILMRSAGCAVNDWADRHFDPHVEAHGGPAARHRRDSGVGGARGRRACSRSARSCWCSRRTGPTILLSLPGAAIALAYPFFKRFFFLPQAFLGIAFSFGIPMAYAAVFDRVPPIAWWLLLLNAFWVIAYDTEYAMVDRDDDVRLGLRTSAIAFGRFDVAAVLFCYAIYLAGMAAVGIRAAAWGSRTTPDLPSRSAAPRITCGSFAAATAIAASPRSCTITGSASPSSPASRSISRCASTHGRTPGEPEAGLGESAARRTGHRERAQARACRRSSRATRAC